MYGPSRCDSAFGDGSPKHSDYQWVQLAGHEGTLMSTGTGCLLKVYNEYEDACLTKLKSEPLRSYVPEYLGELTMNGTRYIQMEDLLFNFPHSSVMDCKMGHRTYVESELESKDAPLNAPRPDLYRKMATVDPGTLTASEAIEGCVTKLRYMQWREAVSSTATLGFRIEAMKKPYEPTKRDFKLVRSWNQVKEHLKDFTRSDRDVCSKFLQRLLSLRTALEGSKFFEEHEFIGSSLLFAHDSRGHVNVWMIDFGKTFYHRGSTLDHRKPWFLGNHEDGYLLGLDNLINLFREILEELFH